MPVRSRELMANAKVSGARNTWQYKEVGGPLPLPLAKRHHEWFAVVYDTYCLVQSGEKETSETKRETRPLETHLGENGLSLKIGTRRCRGYGDAPVPSDADRPSV